MMLGSKGILPPLIPNCYVLCTPAILKIYICHKITTIGIHIYIAKMKRYCKVTFHHKSGVT